MYRRLVPIAVGIGFAVFLGYTGVPTLRHDWASWIPNGAFFSNSWASISGWRTDGFGSPRPYPTDYLLVVLNAIVIGIFGIYKGYVVDVFLIGFATASGGARLANCWSPSGVVTAAAALFATFNPWVYNEVVAGHIYMILAYGAMLLVVSEMIRPEPSSFRLGAFLLMSMGQLQFFLPSLAAVAAWSAVTRRAFWAPIVAAIVALPIWVGVAAESGYLRAIPYALAWQSGASVDPWSVLALSGYFTRYAEALPWYVFAAVWTIAALAAFGAIAALVRVPRRAVWWVLGIFVVWLFVTGSKGLLGNAYVWLVLHVPESGLYRELYDAVAFICVGYAVGGSVASRRFAPLAWLWLACGLALLAGWVMVPPARYWVPAKMLTRITVQAPHNTRYALMPPLQPVRFLWGSGLDPDSVVLNGNVTPLNTQEFSYPESPALVRYALTGDAQPLQALSVAEVLDRPQYRTDYQKLGDQLALPPREVAANFQKSTPVDPLPELVMVPLPGLSSIPAPLSKNEIFFGDVHGVHGPSVPFAWAASPIVSTVRPTSNRVFAADGWVDARSAFVALPDLSEGLGGAVTTNPYAQLDVDPSLWTLAYVNGYLGGPQGRGVAGKTMGYQWLRPFGVARLQCEGLCIVVAQSILPYQNTANSTGRCAGALTFSLPLSWLVVSHLPRSDTCLLRYNVRFDRHWVAFAGGEGLAHVAVDSIANGWVVPAHTNAESLFIVEDVAGVQFVFECLGILLLFAIAVSYGTRAWYARAS